MSVPFKPDPRAVGEIRKKYARPELVSIGHIVNLTKGVTAGAPPETIANMGNMCGGGSSCTA